MATFPNSTGFSFSFSHGRITVNDKQFTAIKNIQLSQELEEGVVRGTSVKVLARTIGQLNMGDGNVTFSDLGNAMEFFESLGDRPLAKIFTIDYTLVNEEGLTKSIVAEAARLTAFKVDHGEGADALGVEFPVSFMSMKVNGKELL